MISRILASASLSEKRTLCPSPCGRGVVEGSMQLESVELLDREDSEVLALELEQVLQ